MRWFKSDREWVNAAHVVRISRMKDHYALHTTTGQTIMVDNLILHDHVKLIESEKKQAEA
jgi:hypothetical protein